MRNRGLIWIGIAVIAVGVVLLTGAVLDIDVWRYLLPLAIIAAGVWLLLRSRHGVTDANSEVRLLGDVRRRGAWQVANQDIWIGLGDVRLDMTAATILPGETRIRVAGLVGSVTLIVPQRVGVSLSASTFLTDAKVFGEKHVTFFTPLSFASEEYEDAECRLRLEVTSLVTDLRVRRPRPDAA